MKISSFTVLDADNIPLEPGAYAFFLNVMSPFNLGTLSQQKTTGCFDEKNMRRLIAALKMTERIHSSVKLDGKIQEIDKKEHLEQQYLVSGKQIVKNNISKTISRFNHKDAEIFADLSMNLSILGRPLYVGIAYDQTLKSRFENHRYDYKKGYNESKFGVRLKNLGISWKEILYVCITSDTFSKNKSLLSVLEKYLQFISKPLLSIK